GVGPHAVPVESLLAPDPDRGAVLLVVHAAGRADSGHSMHVAPPAAHVALEVADDDRLVGPSVRMTPIPVVVVAADRLREPSGRPEQFEDPGLGVVGGEDGGSRRLAV